jgi:hypothetical protein
MKSKKHWSRHHGTQKEDQRPHAVSPRAATTTQSQNQRLFLAMKLRMSEAVTNASIFVMHA